MEVELVKKKKKIHTVYEKTDPEKLFQKELFQYSYFIPPNFPDWIPVPVS
jgi:hypothetical protein